MSPEDEDMYISRLLEERMMETQRKLEFFQHDKSGAVEFDFEPDCEPPTG